jgi:hypothetical protein
METIAKVILVGLVILMIVVFVYHEQTLEFRETCIKIHGTPVHNGRNWECLK